MLRKAKPKFNFSSALMLFFLSALSLFANAKNESVILQLKWIHQFQFAGYYAAKQQGYYSQAGFDVEIRQRNNATTSVNAVLNQQADFGVSDSSLVLNRMRGKPVVVLGAIFQHSPLVLLTRADEGILGPYELKGKRVMYQKGVDDAAFTGMFHQLGISIEDFTHVPHTFDDFALMRGEVDAMSAYSTDQSYLYAKENMAVHVINPLNYGIDFYGDMLFASEEDVKRSPERAQRFLKATVRGWQYALKNPELIISLIKNQYASKKSIGSLRYEAKQTEKMILPNLVEIGFTNSARFERIASIYRQLEMAPKDASLKGLILKEYLNQQVDLPLWFKAFIAITGALLLLALTLLFVARQLRLLVQKRTKQLKKTSSDLKHYIAIVDQHVISSQTNKQGVITSVSAAFCQSSGYSEKELIGSSHNLLRHAETNAEVFKNMWQTLDQGDSWSGLHQNVSKQGTNYWIEYHIDPLFNDDNAIIGYVSIGQDITDKKRIEHLSITDKLTGLYNRVHLDSILEQEFERENRYGIDVSIILCDIDNFKIVNDTYGHLVGDCVLTEFSNLLHKHCRKFDVLGRWGGEEFLIICPSTQLSGAQQFAEKLCQTISDHQFIDAGKVSASFGVTSSSKNSTIDSIVLEADKALYKAKDKGRNRVEVFE